MRHVPRWLGRRADPGGGPRAQAIERETAQKLKMTRRFMRWLR